MDKTVILFTSDHGDCLNDHGHSQKWNMYEQSIRVPALAYWPGHVAAGKKASELVSLIDFGPTILEMAGAHVPEWMEARSLSEFLKSNRDTSRQRVFAEHSNDKILEKTEFMTMVREGHWKLMHFVDYEEGQLFNLKDDPLHQETRQYLLNEILKWRIQSSRKTQGFVCELASCF